MRRGAYALSAAVVVLSAGGAAAQAVPDFSGRWTAAPDQGAGAGRGGPRGGRGAADLGNPGSGWGSEFTVTQDAARLVVQTAHFTARDMQPPLRLVYRLDGPEGKNAVMLGRGTQEQTAKVAWDGGKLVITTTHHFQDPQSGRPATSETKQVLWLESPTLLVVETTHGGALGGSPVTGKTAYRKGEPRKGG
jgi:hypothetical protein